METIGYIYYDNGNREEAIHFTHGEGSAESTRRDAERSTAQLFEFHRKNREERGWGPIPTRFDVHQF